MYCIQPYIPNITANFKHLFNQTKQGIGGRLAEINDKFFSTPDFNPRQKNFGMCVSVSFKLSTFLEIKLYQLLKLVSETRLSRFHQHVRLPPPDLLDYTTLNSPNRRDMSFVFTCAFYFLSVSFIPKYCKLFDPGSS